MRPQAAASLVALDDKRRATLTTLQEAQSRRNAASKEIGKAKGAKDEATASRLMAEVAELKETIAKGEDDERKLDAEIEDALAVIPNLPRDDVPDGHGRKGQRRSSQGRRRRGSSISRRSSISRSAKRWA